jgi:hypothetical protein
LAKYLIVGQGLGFNFGFFFPHRTTSASFGGKGKLAIKGVSSPFHFHKSFSPVHVGRILWKGRFWCLLGDFALISPLPLLGDFCGSRILWSPDFWANFVGAKICGGLIFGRILWEPDFVEA